jgi:hypothetical protein
MSKVRAARQQKRRYPFTEKTRLFDLVKASYHPELAQWLDDIRPYLTDSEQPNWKKVTRLDFKYPRSKVLIAQCIARLLKEIGNDGLKCKKSVFFRYLTSSEHSNINIPEDYLKTLVNNHLRDGIRPLI